MSITIQKKDVVLTGRDAFSYVYQKESENNRLTAFFKALSSSLRKVKIQLDTVKSYIQKSPSEGLARKLQSMSVRPSIAFPFTSTAFDLSSRHRDVSCQQASNISQFLSHFCPMAERGKMNLTEMLSSLDTLDGLVKAFEHSVNEMDDGMFRIAYRDVQGKREEYLEKRAKPFDPDKDFSVKQYRQQLLEILQGHIVQVTSRIVSNIDALAINEATPASGSSGKSKSSVWDSTLLQGRVSACSPGRAIERLRTSMSQTQMDKVLSDKEGEGVNQQMDEWINAYEAIARYWGLSDNLSNSHYLPFRELGEIWKQEIESVTSEIDQIFGAKKEPVSDRTDLYAKLIKRCRANDYKEGTLIKSVQLWQKQQAELSRGAN